MKRMQVAKAMTILFTLTTFVVSADAVELGQVDDFGDETLQGWSVGLPGLHPNPPENVPGGGPGGAGDNHMLLTAIGDDGPGSRLAVFNSAQWAGDYPTAGVERITMDLMNFSASDLHIRVLFENPGVATATTDAVIIPAGSGWVEATFPVTPDDLIPLFGDVNDLLASTARLRIFHNENPTFPPPSVVAQLGVDNIQALPGTTPVEPASWGRLKIRYR